VGLAKKQKRTETSMRQTAEADLGMFSMFGRTGAPTKKGPPQARDCGTPARHFLTCRVWPINAVLRHLKLKSSHGAELHSLACGLWVGGSVCRISKSEIFDVTYLFP